MLTVTNAKHQTAGDLAILCENKYKIQSKFTVVIFEHYQIAHPSQPLSKTARSEVHECSDLRLSKASHGSKGSKCVVKLIAEPGYWLHGARISHRKFSLDDGIGSRACSFQVSKRATNVIPLGFPLSYRFTL
jgi:hypothetical protein